MSGVEACIGVRMQDSRVWDPSFEDGNKLLPPFAGALTAAGQNASPQSVDASSEGAQLTDVSGNGVLLVVAVDDLPKPCTDVAWASMHSASKLDLDCLKLRCHSRFRREAADSVGIGLVATPTVVSEAQEVERLWFSCTTLLPISDSIAPELDQPGLLRMEFQSELRQPLLELLKEARSVSF